MTSEAKKNNPPLPICFARSALFGVSRSNGKIHQNKVIAIAPLNDAKLTYSGPQLGQHHSLLWQAILQEAQIQNARGNDKPFTVASSVLLRAMGGSGNDSDQRARLWRWLKDLTSARLDYSTKFQDYSGSLVFEVSRTIKRGLLVIRLNPTLERLFSNDFVKNDLERKASLGGCSITLWLHDYIATHLRPPAMRVDELRRLCNSPLALPQFRQRLRKGLVKLQECKSPLVISWDIDKEDRLNLTKTPTLAFCAGSKDAARLEASPSFQAAKRKKLEIDRARAQRAGGAL